jgi:excisionase family DNA binding protein
MISLASRSEAGAIHQSRAATMRLMDTIELLPTPATSEKERLAYSLKEAADLLGVDYFSVYRLVQRGKLRACRALRGKLLVPRAELLRLLKTE